MTRKNYLKGEWIFEGKLSAEEPTVDKNVATKKFVVDNFSKNTIEFSLSNDSTALLTGTVYGIVRMPWNGNFVRGTIVHETDSTMEIECYIGNYSATTIPTTEVFGSANRPALSADKMDESSTFTTSSFTAGQVMVVKLTNNTSLRNRVYFCMEVERTA